MRAERERDRGIQRISATTRAVAAGSMALGAGFTALIAVANPVRAKTVIRSTPRTRTATIPTRSTRPRRRAATTTTTQPTSAPPSSNVHTTVPAPTLTSPPVTSPPVTTPPVLYNPPPIVSGQS